MLPRRTRLHRKQFVTTRPAAGPPDKIPQNLTWALALALRLARRTHVSWSRYRRAGRLRRRLLPASFAITLTLGTPSLFALRAGPVLLSGMPTPPAPGRSVATCTAEAHLGIARPELAFAAFQKTAAQSKPAPRLLIGGALRWILRWAHGRLYSRRSSLGEGWRLVSEAFFFTPTQLPSAYPPGRHRSTAAGTSSGRDNGKLRGRY